VNLADIDKSEAAREKLDIERRLAMLRADDGLTPAELRLGIWILSNGWPTARELSKAWNYSRTRAGRMLDRLADHDAMVE
jgi:DNA-binding MarR family transcriptional regulator